jgi:hypothetical protein
MMNVATGATPLTAEEIAMVEGSKLDLDRLIKKVSSEEIRALWYQLPEERKYNPKGNTQPPPAAAPAAPVVAAPVSAPVVAAAPAAPVVAAVAPVAAAPVAAPPVAAPPAVAPVAAPPVAAAPQVVPVTPPVAAPQAAAPVVTAPPPATDPAQDQFLAGTAPAATETKAASLF